nr:MAG TPA: hypothetical protein [Caudoviricetes sp.]
MIYSNVFVIMYLSSRILKLERRKYDSRKNIQILKR